MSTMAAADFVALRIQLRGEVAAVRQELLSKLDRLSAFEVAWTERLNLLEEGHATQLGREASSHAEACTRDGGGARARNGHEPSREAARSAEAMA